MFANNIKDIVGLGEIVGHIKDFIIKLIEILSTRSERKLKMRRLKLENTSEFLRLAEMHNLTPEQLSSYIALANDNIDRRRRRITLTPVGVVMVEIRLVKHLLATEKVAKE
jgi:hypothetical protein